MSVSVVGSLHLDIIVAAARLPHRDETLMGSTWHYKCGGKGGNQAVAAARFGAATSFGGQVGQDDFGDRLINNLKAAGVDTVCVETHASLGSGMSVAITEARGEYGAVVVSGANLAIVATGLEQRWASIFKAPVLMLQNEVAETINLAAARAAKANGSRILLNAAPARAMSEALLDLVDILVVNRVEAQMLSGSADMEKALEALHSPSRDVILTRGAESLLARTWTGSGFSLPSHKVKLVSSHGAGDCFCGALAARLAAGDGLQDACRFANAAAALLVSLPDSERDQLGSDAVWALLAG